MATSSRTVVTTPHAGNETAGAATLQTRLADRFAHWHYEGGKRDLRIDFLRGFAVLAMVADHLGGDPSWLYNVTGGNHFLFSAAEGFVFISGLVMGIVYAGVIAKQGLKEASRKALRRAATLYFLTATLTLAFVALSYATRMPWVDGVVVDNPIARIVERLTLHRAFYLTDVLLMYTLLIAAAPLAFLLLTRKWTLWLLGGSWVLWALYQRWPDQLDIPWKIEDNSIFHFAAWQALFYTGLVVGFHRQRIEAFLRRIPTAPYFVTLTVLSTALIVFQRENGRILAPFAPDGDSAEIMDRFFGKADLRIGRVLAFFVFFQFFLVLTSIMWKPLVAALGWFLMPLGQSALLAYSAHLGVIVLFTKLVPQVPFLHNTSAAANTLVQLSGIFVIWTIVHLTPATKTLAARLRTGAFVPMFSRAAHLVGVPAVARRGIARRG